MRSLEKVEKSRLQLEADKHVRNSLLVIQLKDNPCK